MSTNPLARLHQKKEWLTVGLMSGTSLDGIDAALVKWQGQGADCKAHLIEFCTLPFKKAERAQIAALLHADTETLCQRNFWLGECFAKAALTVIERAKVAAGDVDLIGSHGQTVWHAPPSVVRTKGGTASTLQLGEPAVIAARTGIVTVADFRCADVALGGEGAPLVPYADWVLYRQPNRRVALQNIGGIANVTVISNDLEQVIAFDNGPGNMMIDALAPLASDGADAIDREGRYSARGAVQDDLLEQLLRDDFLALAPPKSTGRERYGEPQAQTWAAAHRDRKPCDLLATLVAFSACAIADSYRRFVLGRGSIDEMLVCGGGAHNQTLMQELAHELSPIPVRPFAESGVSADAKEAVAFSLLALATVRGDRASLPSVTGASRAAVLGKICLP